MRRRYWINAFNASGVLALGLVILWCFGMSNTTLRSSIPWGRYLANALLFGAVACFICGIVLWSVHLVQTHQYRGLTFVGSLFFLAASIVVYVVSLIFPSLTGGWIMLKYLLACAATCFILWVILLLFPSAHGKKDI